MRKSSILGIGLVLFALCSTHASAQDKKQSADQLPMSAGDYSILLDQLQSDLDEWEPALGNIDPGKGDVSYKVGLQIAKNKKTALLQIRNARALIAQQKKKHSVYGELALGGDVSTLSIQLEELALSDALNDMRYARSAHNRQASQAQVQICPLTLHTRSYHSARARSKAHDFR